MFAHRLHPKSPRAAFLRLDQGVLTDEKTDAHSSAGLKSGESSWTVLLVAPRELQLCRGHRKMHRLRVHALPLETTAS